MAKLYFYYGAMSSNKSGNLLSNAHTYTEQGKRVLLLKPSFDTRSAEGHIESRSGIPSKKAICFTNEDNLYELVKSHLAEYTVTRTHVGERKYDAILIDEVHFATKAQIRELVDVVDVLGINVITYGLKNSYIDGTIFDSIQELIYQCNAMYEIKSTCQFCNSKATHHLRMIGDKIIYNGEQNIVGDVVGEEKYLSVCRKHYYHPSI